MNHLRDAVQSIMEYKIGTMELNYCKILTYDNEIIKKKTAKHFAGVHTVSIFIRRMAVRLELRAQLVSIVVLTHVKTFTWISLSWSTGQI